MKTKHARLIRSAIKEAEEKADQLDINFFWVEKRKGYHLDIERYKRNRDVWDKRFNSALWTKAYSHTIRKRGYTLSGATLYSFVHMSFLERIYNERFLEKIREAHCGRM